MLKNEEKNILKKSKFIAPCAEGAEEEDDEFIWYPYIPRNEFTVLMADGGTGKTTFCCGIATAITKGIALPGCDIDENPTQGKVLFITGEDTIGRLRKKLRICGADLSRINILDCYASEGLSLSDENELQLLIEQYSPELVIIDPWQSFLGGPVNINRIDLVRPMFQKVSKVAKNCNCGIILVSHVNKKAQSENANNAATGSADLINAARSAIRIIFSDEQGEEDIRIAVHTKSNNAALGKSLKYRISQQKGLEWIGFSDINRRTLENAARFRKTPAEIIQKSVAFNSALFDAIQEKAVLNKHINISYDQFKEEFGTYIFETTQPKKEIDNLSDKLNGVGIKVTTGKTVNVNKKTRNGFEIYKYL